MTNKIRFVMMIAMLFALSYYMHDTTDPCAAAKDKVACYWVLGKD